MARRRLLYAGFGGRNSIAMRPTGGATAVTQLLTTVTTASQSCDYYSERV